MNEATAPLEPNRTAGHMKVLVADDEMITRRLLDLAIRHYGFQVEQAVDGQSALAALEAPDGPRIAIIDWLMPGLDGLDVCRRLRLLPPERYVYTIILTVRSSRQDQIAGLDAGADDFLTKPYDPSELAARLRVGSRLLELQDSLRRRSAELEAAQAHVQKLEGLLPICMHCKRIRDAGSRWHPLEAYIEQHSDAVFTHSLCATCLEEHFPEK